MKSNFSLIILLFILYGCSNKQEPIMLVCEGIETLTGNQSGKILEPDTKHSKRTFNFKKEEKIIKTGILNFDTENKSKFKEVNKLVWVFSVDNGVEMFEEETYMYLSNKTLSKRDYINVSDTELFINETISSEYNDGTKLGLWEDYSLSVNRISGDFHEQKIENYTKGTSFRIITDGNCKKVDKKF